MSLLRGTGARLAAGATLALLAVSGCSATQTQTPVAIPSSSPTPAPLFANDAEALAAAKKAYGKYQEMGDLIFSEGGQNGSRIAPLVSKEFRRTEMAGFDEALSNGWHSVGRSSFDSLTIQEIDQEAPNGVRVITAYLCSDVSQVDVVNAEGRSVVQSSRSERTPFQVTFDVSPLNSRVLVVGSRTLWAGDGVC